MDLSKGATPKDLSERVTILLSTLREFLGHDVDIFNEKVRNCRKSCNHERFINIDKLTVKDLPSGYQNPLLLQYIKDCGLLTVKVIVKNTSGQRHIEENKFFLSTPEFSNMTRQGSGWCAHVLENDILELIPCTKENCKFSNEPHKVRGPIYIMTARHLVFDQSEAVETEVHFSNDGCGDDSRPEWIAEGVDVICPKEGKDYAIIKCYSHEPSVFSRLRSMTDAVLKSSRTLFEADININTSGKDLAFIISHPHNLPKQISFGRVLEKKIVNSEYSEERIGMIEYIYDIPSCPGSSGAAVCIMGTDGTRYFQFPHSTYRQPTKLLQTSMNNETRISGENLGSNFGMVEWLEV